MKKNEQKYLQRLYFQFALFTQNVGKYFFLLPFTFYFLKFSWNLKINTDKNKNNGNINSFIVKSTYLIKGFGEVLTVSLSLIDR